MGINREVRDETLFLENTDNGERIEIRETINEGSVCVAPKGELRESIAHDLEDELTSIALVRHNIIMDMKDVSFVANSVMRMMLDVQHIVDSIGGEFLIRNLRGEVMSAFEKAGLDGVFEIEESISGQAEERAMTRGTHDEM